MAVEAGRRLAHYQLTEKLGEGGMGEVWKAHDLQLDRDIAIKILPERFATDVERRTRFEREAKAVAALRHPNIVTIYSVEEVESCHFFTMELVDGEPLSVHIHPGGASLERFLALAVPLVGAIAAAHERGIIHLDLKPGNVLVGADDTVKVLDFGLAQFRRRASLSPGSDTTITSLGDSSPAGTIRYMSPEQLRAEPLDHRSDPFSLGVLLYELATGRPPFGGANPADVTASILKDEPTPALDLNPRLPAALGRILEQCLEKNPGDRMASASELRERLSRLRDDASAPRRAPSIAVFPFTDMSPEKDQAYLCEGIAEEIRAALGRLRGLKVASRAAAFALKDSSLAPQELGRRLHVESLLEGSVRKSGSRLRIVVHLVDARGGFQLTTEAFDRDMTDVFAMQEEIARSVVGALKVRLTPQEDGALATPPTRHVQAYDYYLRGRKFYYQFTRREMEFALQLFSRAVELDRRYALAHAGLADCWTYLYLYAERNETLREQADAASRRAVELAPDLAQAHASRGAALSLAGLHDEAVHSFEAAIRLEPALYEAWYFYARSAFAVGNLEQAASLYEQARRAKPDDYQSPLLVAQIYDGLGRHEDAKASRMQGIAIAEEWLRLHPEDTRALYMAANGLVAVGDRERGLTWARRARAAAPDEPMILYNVGCIEALAGNTDEALDCLMRAVDHGLTQRGWFEHDSNLDSIRADPRFVGLLARLV